MTTPNKAALEFLLTRRSRPAKTLTTPAPTRAELSPILTAAARTPDHGKLEPWRFVVIEPGAMARIGDIAETCALSAGQSPEQAVNSRGQFDRGILAVAVIEVRKPSEKIPELEQTYSAGAACLALLNAALASGWGANWLSGTMSHDRGFMRAAFDLTDNEYIAGFIHIATQTNPAPERPRPNLQEIVTWVSA